MEDELFSVADSAVLLSGASRGIGRELAAGFVQRGARVFITGRDERTLAQAAQDISTVDSTVHPIVCDAADEHAIKRCVAAVVAEHGTIDTLVNVAGVNQRQAVESYSPEQFDFILDINLRGAFLMSQEVGRHRPRVA